ncbi:hypothetical protein ACQP3F_33790, partial [Escherichia coli]
ACLESLKPWVPFPAHKPGMVVNAQNPSTLQVEEGESEGQVGYTVFSKPAWNTEDCLENKFLKL